MKKLYHLLLVTASLWMTTPCFATENTKGTKDPKKELSNLIQTPMNRSNRTELNGLEQQCQQQRKNAIDQLEKKCKEQREKAINQLEKNAKSNERRL